MLPLLHDNRYDDAEQIIFKWMLHNDAPRFWYILK
jgi:hypothetical protein